MTKKIMISLIAVLLLTALAVPALAITGSELNDEALIGKTRGALNSCLAGMESGNSTLQFRVQDLTPCFAGGSLKKVSVYKITTFNCPPGQLCPLYMPILPVLVGEVVFDCEDNVISTNCCPDGGCGSIYL